MTTPPTTTDEGLSIHRRMALVLADLPAIGKNQRNSEQGFMFRGYDDVMNALNPVLARHGVFFVPDVIERLTDKRATRSGGVMYEVNLHVRFTFYGPDGDSVTASGWGEGTDMGDKATNKAMTNALKYVLFQTFAISTQEAHETDTDRTTPEGTVMDEVPCRGCGKPIQGARTSPEPMRDHVVKEHGFVRLPDGQVMHPDAYAKHQAEQAAAAAATGGDEAQAAPSSTAGDNPVDDTPGNGTATDTADESAWVEDLRGQDLIATAKSYGVSASGTVAAIKARIRQAIADGVEPTDASATDTADPAPTDTAPSTAADAPADADGADTPTTDDADAGAYQCPDCTESFPTEADYHAHWYAEHDTDGDGDPDDATDAPADDAATLIESAKARIAGLTGEHARAYGKYRREAHLPRPDEMNAEQARDLIAFLDGLGA